MEPIPPPRLQRALPTQAQATQAPPTQAPQNQMPEPQREENENLDKKLRALYDDITKTPSFSAKITDFDSVDVTADLPLFYASIQKWEKHVSGLKPDGFKKLQKRFTQLGNIINKETEKRL